MPPTNRKFMRMNFFSKHSAFRGLETGEDIHLMKVFSMLRTEVHCNVQDFTPWIECVFKTEKFVHPKEDAYTPRNQQLKQMLQRLHVQTEVIPYWNPPPCDVFSRLPRDVVLVS
jgi:hypothetical protein